LEGLWFPYSPFSPFTSLGIAKQAILKHVAACFDQQQSTTVGVCKKLIKPESTHIKNLKIAQTVHRELSIEWQYVVTILAWLLIKITVFHNHCM